MFNTCLQFGGAAGTALFSTILSVAQAGAGEGGGCHVPSRYGCRWQLDVRYHDWYRGHCHLLLDCGVPYWCET